MTEAFWSGIRAEVFPAPPGVYLNTAAEGIWPLRSSDGFARYATAKSRGSLGRPDLTGVESEARDAVARLLGADAAEIAFVSSTSRALDIAAGLAAPAPGSNVVMLDSEFPSALITGHRLRDEGVDLRLVPAIGTDAAEDELAARVDDRTALVVVSAVSFITGRRIDVSRLRGLLAPHAPVLVVDGIQAVGVVDLPLDDIDVLVFGTYKWLVGPHGVAVVRLNPRTMAGRAPHYRGWRGLADAFEPDRTERHTLHTDARRLEDGMPNLPGLAALVESLAVLEGIGAAARRDRVAELTSVLAAGLAERGIAYGPTDPDRRVGIITIPVADAEGLAARLATDGIHVWGREGVLRASPYLYNTPDDVRRLVVALPAPPRGAAR